MPPDLNGLGTPEEWLNRAKSNLAIAKQSKSDEIYFEDLCFETQQAAEKALKAVLLLKGIKFRFVHDIAEFLTLLEQNGIIPPEDVRTATVPTPVYVYSSAVVYTNPAPLPAYAYPDPRLTGQYSGENPPGEWITVPGQWVDGKWIPTHSTWVPVNP